MRTIHREIVGGFIFTSDGYILLGKSGPGGVNADCHVIPGGGVEAGETLREALIREVREEVGLDISQVTITHLPEKASGQSEKTLRESGERVMVHMVFNDFHVVLPDTAAKTPLVCDDDFQEAVWVPIGDLPGLTLTETTVAVLRRLGCL